MSSGPMRMTVNRSVVLLLPVAAGLFALAGCAEREKVVSYTVPKPHVLEKQNPPPAAVAKHPTERDAQPSRSVEARDRMLAAIVPQGERFWFFKVTGPKDAVGARIEEFYSLIRSVRFSGDRAEPQWTLPEGWEQRPGSAMRFATLEIPSSEGPLELSVIPLPNQSVLDNVNRWLGQMGVSPITREQLESGVELAGGGDVRQIQVDGRTVTLVNVVGAMQDSGMGGAPFAMGRTTPTLPSPPAESGPSPLSFKTPEGWAPGQVGGFRKAAFNVTDGGSQAEITVIDLAGASGDLLANVNRWRGQIGLEPTTEPELRKELQTIPVGGTTGQYVHLVGPEQAILGVIVERGGKSWFFKMTGDVSLVEREQERFEQFVRSVEFK